MKVVILAGGRGVRMRPLTYTVPKPLLPIGEKPILEIIIENLRSQGFVEFILAVGYRAELIETYFRDGSQLGVSINYVREAEPRGTAGALALVRQAHDFAAGESILVVNGDILTKLDFHRLLGFHEEGSWDMTVAARRYESQLPYGVLRLDGERVLGIREKPLSAADVSAGIYVLRAEVLAQVPEGVPFDMPDLVAKLLDSGQRVGACRVTEFWMSLDHVGHLEEAGQALAVWSEP